MSSGLPPNAVVQLQSASWAPYVMCGRHSRPNGAGKGFLDEHLETHRISWIVWTWTYRWLGSGVTWGEILDTLVSWLEERRTLAGCPKWPLDK